MINDVKEMLNNEICLKDNDCVVVGVSGGPDSMALLYLLLQYRKSVNITIVCAHVNHNVREESEAEKVFLEEFCARNLVAFEYMKIDNYSEDNFHNEARSIRYKYFDSLVNSYNAVCLMTAHHGDDLIETILMRVVRGSTLKGYAGFAKEVDKGNYKIVRPLIEYTKDEILEFDKENNISYVTDMSNMKSCYTRNRYRKEVLPFLKKEDINVHKKFLKFSKLLYSYNEYIDKQMLNDINKVLKDGVLEIDKFLKLDKLIQLKIINYILEKIYNDDLIIINDSHCDLIYHLITSSKANSIIHLPNNVVFVKSYGIITFRLYEQDDVYETELNDVVNLPNGRRIIRVKSSDDNSNNVIRINSNNVVMPLYVRTRKIADKIETKGMNGHKKVNNIFIDNKIPIDKRNMWPIVCDSENNVLWIPGLKKSKFDVKSNEKYDIIFEYI
ncbi:MAG: tRNA lysidine(34) synthetase TilS [Bacilli bacterium]